MNTATLTPIEEQKHGVPDEDTAELIRGIGAELVALGITSITLWNRHSPSSEIEVEFPSGAFMCRIQKRGD